MGWKLDAAAKRLFCASATKHVRADSHTIVFDMNAILRRECTYGPEVSPVAAVNFFWKRHVSASQGTTFYFAFDSPTKIPQARIDFHATVRYKDTLTLVGPPIHAHVALGVKWADAWKTTSKARMWEVIAASLFDKVLHHAREDVTYIVDAPAGPILSHPDNAAYPVHNFGEADCKCAMFVKMVGGGVVTTIDWDMVVQGVFLFPRNTLVDIGKVWKKGASLAFSKGKALPGATRVPEIIEPALIGAGHRASIGFAMLCMAGVDYCEGLKRFGFRQTAMAQLILANEVPPFFVIANAPPMTATLSVNDLVGWLTAVPLYRPREKSILALNSEFQLIFFCALYFAGFDKMAIRGGPTVQDINFFPGAATAAAALSGEFMYPDVVYVEQC